MVDSGFGIIAECPKNNNLKEVYLQWEHLHGILLKRINYLVEFENLF